MKVLGVTGGVGSGKSRVLYELQHNYGAYVVEADKVAHQLMMPGEIIYNKIVEEFGREILNKTEPYHIDRAILGAIVFNDSKKLDKLNSITHPAVKEEIIKLINKKKLEKDVRLFVIEAALLIECGYKSLCHEIWYIWVSKEERIKRLMENRGYTREKCLSIFSNQKEDEYYKNHASSIINNQNSFMKTANQLKDLLNIFMEDDIIN